MRRTPLLASAVLLCWLAGYVWSASISFYSRALLQYFAGGLSEFKPLFGLIWCLVCCAALSLPPGSKRTAHWLIPVASLVGAHLITFASHLLFVSSFQLPMFGYAVAAIDREISSNQLLHIHVTKGWLFILLRNLGLEAVQLSSDPGRFFSDTIPEAFFLMQIILIVTAGVGVLILLRARYEQWQSADQTWLVVPYILTSSAALRCAVDGGPLDWTSVALTPIFLALACTSRPFSWSSIAWLALVETCGLGMLVGLHSLAGTAKPWGVGVNSCLSVLFVALAALGARLVTARRDRLKSGACLALGLVLLFFLSRDTFWAWDLRSWNRLVPQGTKVLLYDYYSEWDYPVKWEEGRLAIRTFDIQTSQSGSELFASLGVRFNFSRVQFPGLTCDERQGYQRSGRVFLVEGSLRDLKLGNPIFAKFELTKCQKTEACTYRYTAEFPGCVPDTTTETIVNHLYELGMTKVILLPEAAERSTPAQP